MATQPGETPPRESDRSVGELVLDVSERVSLLVREEIELAKAEVTEKITQLLKGSVVGVAAGVFVLCALFMLMFAFGWLINDLLGVTTAIWAGFLIEAILFLVIAAIAGLVAKKLVEKGSSPVPTMAIAEVQVTKETLSSDHPTQTVEQAEARAHAQAPGGAS
jgi:Fe2+ transport system protein B